MNYQLQQLIYADHKLTKQVPLNIVPSQKHVAMIIHVFYSDIWREELLPYLAHIKTTKFDLYITVPKCMSDVEIINIIKEYPAATLYQTENRGRDVLPFLQVMNIIGTKTYDYICKLHTKKSAGRDLGTVWRKLLYFDLIGSNTTVTDIIKTFETNSTIGMITGKNTILDAQKYYLGNREKVDMLIHKLHMNIDDNYHFAGGTMFWIRPNIIEPLIALYRDDELKFEEEKGQMDHTLAHAIERFLGILCYANNKKILGSPSFYSELKDDTLNEVAALVLSQTYADKDMFLTQKESLAEKDALIISKHKEILDRDGQVKDLGEHLTYATSIVELRDQQLNFKNRHIAFLNSLTLKRRVKQKIKKIIPDRLLTLLGLSPYQADEFLQDDCPTEVAQ